MGRPPPDPELVFRAYQLWGQRMSLRQIGREVGASASSVREWIAQARRAEEWREAQERSGRVDRMSTFLNELARIAIAELEERDDDGRRVRETKDVLPGLMKVVQEINKIEGNYAPTRTVAEAPTGPGPNPELARLIAAERRAVRAMDEENNRRELQ